MNYVKFVSYFCVAKTYNHVSIVLMLVFPYCSRLWNEFGDILHFEDQIERCVLTDMLPALDQQLIIYKSYLKWVKMHWN